MLPVSATESPLLFRRVVFVGVAVLIILGFLPRSYLASPRWDVWVVADNGQPLADVNVVLSYQNYSAEDSGHSVISMTDEKGHLQFSPNYERASFFQKVFYTLSSARALVHASFGRHAHVFAYGPGYTGSAVSGKYVTDWRGSPDSMESRIIAKQVGN